MRSVKSMIVKPTSRFQLSKYAGYGAGAVFLTGILLQIVRTVMSPPAGLTVMHSHIATVILAALWGGAAYGSIARKRAFLPVVVLGLFGFFAHFAVASAARGHVELWYLFAVPVVAALAWAAFRGELVLGHRERPEAPTHRGYMNV